MDYILLLSASKTLLNKLKRQLMDRLEMSDAGDVSTVVGMNVTCDCEKGAITPVRKITRRMGYSATVWKVTTSPTPPK